MLKLSFLGGFSIVMMLQAVAAQACDPACQQLIARASAWEQSQRASEDDSFYSVPSNYSTSLKPGSLLKLEIATNLTNYTVPASLTVSRFIYTTTDLSGTILPASAYILWPFAPLTSQSSQAGFETSSTAQLETELHYPFVAWGHGTAGTFGPCAPSNYRALQYHFQVPFALASQGIAVVAPDYLGLGVKQLANGTRIPHPWASGPSLASDLANAITAARVAFPSMISQDGPFVAMGHSQGALAAWSFAERMANDELTLPGYKGTVAIAPPLRVLESIDRASQNLSLPWASAILGIQNLLMHSITTVYPQYGMAGLTQDGMSRWNAITEVDGCLPVKTAAGIGLLPSNIAHANWTQNRYVQQFNKRTLTGGKKIKGPLLALVGELDPLVQPDSLSEVIDETCKAISTNDSLEFNVYKGLSHFPLVQGSQQKWMGWIKDHLLEKTDQNLSRRGGLEPCDRKTIQGLQRGATNQGVFPNFLVASADVGAAWEYAL
ncbi:uncharacterized protein JN550_010671 [Neoarthrinium moseri]|uniref:uncharacterized protein n=1 Tax=Neoarthrinium moseri TaxID=1658444 RepID=UPI001FDE6842|nr:uncharacterized protein JN550_010671 [Neoarthrinium moseri]KAI1861731.1 hypothetical protein JN550_010671 [Neoarthrinium moseri]